MAPGTGPTKDDHPRYSLRRFIIISDVFGIFTAICVAFTYGIGHSIQSIYLYELFWLLGSIAVCIWDLVDWRLRHGPSSERRYANSFERTPLLSSTVENHPCDNPDTRNDDDGDDDDKKDRPRPIITILDLFFSLALFWVWAGILTAISMEFGYSRGPYSETSIIILASYSSCSMIVSSIGHMCCFWKELVMKMRLDWARGASERRWHWQEQYTRFIEAAIQNNNVRSGQLNESQNPVTVRCSCPCNEHADDIARIVRQENTIVERLLRVLGKSPDTYEAIPNDDEAVDAATIRPEPRSKEIDFLDTDIDAGPSQPHNFMPTTTPSASTSDNDLNTTDALGDSEPTIAYQSSAASGRTASDRADAVLVKKKGRNLRKEKEREGETMHKA